MYHSPEQLENMRGVAANILARLPHCACSLAVLGSDTSPLMSTLVNLQPELVQHKQSALDEVWAGGGVSSLPAQSMLIKPATKAVETVRTRPDQNQQATGSVTLFALTT